MNPCDYVKNKNLSSSLIFCLHDATTLQHAYDKQNDRNDYQDMEKSTQRVRCDQSQNPEKEQSHNYCPHNLSKVNYTDSTQKNGFLFQFYERRRMD
jgi:hypothetical protein